MSSIRRCVPRLMLLACGTWAACRGEASDSAAAPAVRDSAGIRIVEYQGDLDGAPVPIELVWEHGHGPDDYSFRFVYAGALRPYGGAVVGDYGNQEVVAIGPAGSEHFPLARTGEGPSEVRTPRAIQRVGQASFWVEDVGNAKLMLFEGDSLASTVSTAGDATLTRGMMPQGVDAEGRLLMTTSSSRSDFDKQWLDGHMTRFDPVSGALDTVGSYPMRQRRPDQGINPFAPSGTISSAAGGFVHARMDVPELTWRAANGEVTQIVRWHPVLEYPTEEIRDDHEAWLRAELRRVNPQLGGERLEQFLQERVARYEVDASVPLPLFGQLHGSPDGDVWLSEFTPGNMWASRYVVVSAGGEWIGRVEFPSRVRILDVTDEFVLAVFANDLDVQGVAVYRYDREGQSL